MSVMIMTCFGVPYKLCRNFLNAKYFARICFASLDVFIFEGVDVLEPCAIEA